MNPATALAAVEQATEADRADLLKRLTKELLPDPARRMTSTTWCHRRFGA